MQFPFSECFSAAGVVAPTPAHLLGALLHPPFTSLCQRKARAREEKFVFNNFPQIHCRERLGWRVVGRRGGGTATSRFVSLLASIAFSPLFLYFKAITEGRKQTYDAAFEADLLLSCIVIKKLEEPSRISIP